MTIADILTDDVIASISSEVRYRVGCVEMDGRFADVVADIVRDELLMTRTPLFRFVVAVRAANRDKAIGLIRQRIGGDDRFRLDEQAWPVPDEREAMRGGR